MSKIFPNSGDPFRLISANSTNATLVKGAAGRLTMVSCNNANASPRYLKFYDKATAPVVGTDTPVYTFALPGSGSLQPISIPEGIEFRNGIGIGLTTGSADSDTGAVGAGDHIVNLGVV